MKSISIVLIIKDDADIIECSLRSIEYVKYPRDLFEVIVVDDGSLVPVEKIVNFSVSYSLRFHYLKRSKTSSRAKARNYGAEFARFDYLLFVDGDHFFEEDTLKNYSNYFNFKKRKKVVLGTRRHIQFNHRTAFLAGNRESYQLNFYKKMKKYGIDERLLLQDFMKSSFNELHGNWHLFWSCNFCIERELFFSIGGFDEDFIKWGFEDVELGYRLKLQGNDFELYDNPVWHFLSNQQITEEKYQGWLENIIIFYEKYKDVKILQQFEFENVFFYGAGINKNPSISWLESYKNFENKIAYQSQVKRADLDHTK